MIEVRCRWGRYMIEVRCRWGRYMIEVLMSNDVESGRRESRVKQSKAK